MPGFNGQDLFMKAVQIGKDQARIADGGFAQTVRLQTVRGTHKHLLPEQFLDFLQNLGRSRLGDRQFFRRPAQGTFLGEG